MPAAGAEAVEFQAVSLDGEPVSVGHFLLQLFDLAIFEFDNLSAPGADQVVVMALVGHVIVLGLRAEVAGLCDTGVTEEVQCAIDGGQSEVGVGLGELMIHRFGCDVLLSKKGAENKFPLAGEFQLMLCQMIFQRIHLFCILARRHFNSLQAGEY